VARPQPGAELIGDRAGAGIAILLLAARLLLERLLFEVRASDPLTISLVTLVLAAVAVVAAWAPASRASRVDPIQALRCE